MAYVGTRWRARLLKLTVIEYLAEIDFVRVHCVQHVCLNTTHPRMVAKHLVTTADILHTRPYSLFYVASPYDTTVMSLGDDTSYEVFVEWLDRNPNSIYAVIVNRNTPDLKKVVKLFVTRELEARRNHYYRQNLQRTAVARPHYHRPVPRPPQVESRRYNNNNQQQMSRGNRSFRSNNSRYNRGGPY